MFTEIASATDIAYNISVYSAPLRDILNALYTILQSKHRQINLSVGAAISGATKENSIY